MTQEEKAKRYDGNYKAYTELINRLEDVKEAIKKQNYGIAMDILCKPYPQFQVITHSELKESEDEKIKKELIEFLKEEEAKADITSKRSKTLCKYITWLEKQGKKTQGKSALEAAKEEKVDNLNCVNPADKVKPKFKTGDRVIGIVSGMPYFITEVCDDHYYTESGCIIMFCSQDNFELYEQKSTEWSKEDEDYINDLIKYFSQNERLKNTEEDIVIWLESLRPQNTWKPSDEQIDILNMVLTNESMDDNIVRILRELREQLKKLREE